MVNRIKKKKSISPPLSAQDISSDFIKFGKFKKEIFYNTNVEMSDKTKEILLKYGRSHIVNDEEKILDYAINKMLKDSISYFKSLKKRKLLKHTCHNCSQFTTNWQKRWGCIGNPDNKNQGCEHFVPKD